MGEDDVIRQVLTHDISPQLLKEDLENLLRLEGELLPQGKPIRVLIDSSEVRNASSGTRKQALYNLTQMHYERIGIFGTNPYLTQLVNWILRATGRYGRIKVFPNEEAALTWLKS